MWEALQRSYTKEPYQIRRLLTEGAVRAASRRLPVRATTTASIIPCKSMAP